ncbi:hypothetical protein PYCCODRAFT_1428887 [Trametes coccinea BRFM310]|uniref:Uncharacterized protein n=1 Tax=Trametes coccinea (strain BRFM310) TaxID=1353009 RepID=A0A1Y2I6N7_TRAC3|nr:hypothetical protein PYCCODRAFT_1428887 [Trametes coccinea BRFM310]
MSASTTAKSAPAKGKKAATPAQLRAAAREEVNALFASAPGGSIAGEEEYSDFARRVLAQLDIIGGGEATEEVAYQAARLVRETIGFATGVEGEEVNAEVPWTHPLYRQAFAQVQAELAAERTDREGEDEAPASVAEVEAEVGGAEAEVDELSGDDVEIVEEPQPAARTRSQRKVPPRPIRVPQHKPAAKVVVSKPKRALPADEPAAAPSPKKKARTTQLTFPAPVWRPASAEPPSSIRCAYCAAHPGGGRCVLREGFAKCDRCLLSRQGCWAPSGGKKSFAEWYEDKGLVRAVRLDGVIAAKVIRSRGRASDMPAWVKAAWEEYRADRLAAYKAGEGSLGDSTASEGSRPASAKSAKVVAPAKAATVAVPGSGSSTKLSHVEIPVSRVRLAVPAGPSPSSQPAASSSSRAIPPPSSPSPAPATPPTASVPLPAPPRAASPSSAPRPPSVPPFAAEAPLAPPSFRTPAAAPVSAMPPPPPSTPQQLGLGGLVERETAWFRETFARHLVANFSRPQDTTPLDPRRTPAGNAYVQALESVRDALSGQVAALASTRDELRLRARNAPLSDAEIFGHPANR